MWEHDSRKMSLTQNTGHGGNDLFGSWMLLDLDILPRTATGLLFQT